MKPLLKVSKKDGRIVIDFKNSIIISKYKNIDEYGFDMGDIDDKKPNIVITNATVIGNFQGNIPKVFTLMSYLGYNKYFCKFIRILLRISDYKIKL